MRTLNGFGRRVTGSRAASLSRDFLRDTLADAGISSRELRTVATASEGEVVEFAHVLGSVPGRSNDVILLAAHYDSPAAAADSDEVLRRGDQRASGTAFLLELARVLRSGPPPEYTFWFAFIDGDAARAEEPAPRLGTQSLVDDWSRSGEVDDIRAAIFFGAVGDRDLPMLRDIDSPRVYREVFWEAAADLGDTATFPAASPYGRAETGRSIFAQLTLRSSVALENADAELAQPTEPAGADAATETATDTAKERPRAPVPVTRRASAGFDTVGRVTLEALRRTAAKLRKIDRFAQAPLMVGRDPVEPPAARP
jgi:Zn-dependent M28 family amino/carboxypeptidase